MGKSFLAQSLGYAAIIVAYTARFCHGDNFFRSMSQDRMGNSVDRTFRSFLSLGLIILDDLNLHRLEGQWAAELYKTVVSGFPVSSFVFIFKRAEEE